VASIIECIDLCCAINLMRVLISLTAPRERIKRKTLEARRLHHRRQAA
jgi:hypothetical protein